MNSIKFSKEIKILSLIFNEPLKKADAIICLEGDGFSRAKKAIELFNKKKSTHIVVSGNYNDPPFSIQAKKLARYLIKKGVPAKKIILENTSQNTLEQAQEVMKLAKKKKWKKIILAASHFHQLRAYLTFLKAMKNLNLRIQIFNAPVKELPWFRKTSLGVNRLRLMEKEFVKINQYLKKGHLARIEEAIEYQKWKEKQSIKL